MYWLCYCVASCNRYLMLINHPTDGAKKKKKHNFFLPKILLSGLFANYVEYGRSEPRSGG